MRTPTRTHTRPLTAAAAGGAAVALAAGVLALGPAEAATRATAAPAGKVTTPGAVGLGSDGQIITFNVSSPDKAVRRGVVKGLTGDTRLVGLDYRPANGKLYGVGDQGGVYTVLPGRAQATKVGQLSVPLQGTRFDIDFNPAADRLRIVSNTGQNLRHDVDGGATTPDLPLTTDMAATSGVVAAAYTNNDNDGESERPTGTVLYVVNTTTDTLSIQAPANNGTLVPVGPLRFDALFDAGLDIYSRVDAAKKTVSNVGYATLRTKASGLRLYTVDLTTGKATLVRGFPGSFAVVDLAVVPQAKPAS